MTERLNNSADTDMPQNGDAGHLRAKASVDESKEESQPLLAAFAVLIFWLFLRVASFNFP